MANTGKHWQTQGEFAGSPVLEKIAGGARYFPRKTNIYPAKLWLEAFPFETVPFKPRDIRSFSGGEGVSHYVCILGHWALLLNTGKPVDSGDAHNLVPTPLSPPFRSPARCLGFLEVFQPEVRLFDFCWGGSQEMMRCFLVVCWHKQNLTTLTWQPPPDMSWWGSLEVK